MMKYFINLLLVLLFGFTNIYYAQKEAPTNVVVSSTIKYLSLNKSLKGDVKIFVVGNDAIANELKKNIGNTIVSATITDVKGGSDVPSEKYEIIFCCSSSKVSAVQNYAKQNKSLSITNIPSLAKQGITLGFGIDDDQKPIVYLNLGASNEQGMAWNPVIMKVVQVIKD